MSLHTDGQGNWVTGDELGRMQAENQRTGVAAIFALIGAYLGPKVGVGLGLGSGKSMVVGFVAGGVVGYLAGTAIIVFGVLGLLVWWFIKA